MAVEAVEAIEVEVAVKKVLCSAEKSSVIWAEPHSRSSAEHSAEPNVRSITTERYY